MSSLPRRLGRYELMHELARGGMGVVYLARLRSVGGFSRLVAVKQCLPEHTRDKDFVAMFLDEARLAARINHPNVVPTLDVEHSAEGLFFAMDYVEGERVVDVIRASIAKVGAVPVAVALRIIVDALRGLHAAHTLEDSDGAPLNIVHRDVSPQNIVVGYDGLTRILDFGVARAERRLTRTLIGGIPKGKLAYMAPEQLLEQPMDARADVFAAGIVAWELLSGARLFDANTEALLVAQVMELRIQRPSSRRPELSPALDDVVLTALAREPSERFANAQAFADALERCGVSPASHQVVAHFVREALASQREQKIALRRRIESMPALDEPVAQAQAPARASAVPPEPRASAAPAPPRTVAFDPGSTAHPALAAPQPVAQPVWSPPVMAPPVSMTSVPGTVRPTYAPQPPAPAQGGSLLAYSAIAMVVLGVAIGAAGYVVKERARRERAELAPIEMPSAVPLLAPTSIARTREPLVPLPIPGATTATTAIPSVNTQGAVTTAADAAVAPSQPRTRRARPSSPQGTEF
jgi:serine/threonine protein kinase